MDSDEEPVKIQENKPRKRKVNVHSWKRTVKKKKVNCREDKTCRVSCSHDKTSKICQAGKLDLDIIIKISRQFYTSDKEQQDSFILKNIISSAPKKVKKVGPNSRRRDVTIKYTIPIEEDKTIFVCARSFCSILGIGKKRVNNIVKYWLVHQSVRKETRGGPRTNQKVANRTERVMTHIQSFTCKASHYGRSKTPDRKYLPNTLSIRQMWKLFTSQDNNDDCTYNFYYHVFVTKFNLGFGSPACDVCSDCVRYKEVLKSNKPDSEKEKVAGQFWFHKVSAKKFYENLNDFDSTDKSVRTIVFDLMQNQPLPKTPVGEAFYSRQLWQYYFGIVNHHGKNSRQSKKDVHFYTWGEYEAGRGSNSMASALFDYITTYVPKEVKTLRLFSDSCAGQNKNYTMIAMMSSLAKQLGLKILYFFPIRGHSYLPADRSFGRVEKILRKMDTILTPEEYHIAFSKVRVVKKMYKDFDLYDWKRYQNSVFKSQQTFQISEARVLEINGNTVGQKNNFFGQFEYHTVLGRGKTWFPRNLVKLPIFTNVTEEKRIDVKSLLNKIEVNDGHPAMPFYVNALQTVAPSKVKKSRPILQQI